MLLFYQKHKTLESTKLLLETAAAHRLADIFVASFEGSFDKRLAMLDAIDLQKRLSKAIEIITRHVQVFFSSVQIICKCLFFQLMALNWKIKKVACLGVLHRLSE